EASAAMEHRARDKSSLRKEVVGGVNIAIDEDIFPGDKGVLQHKNGVILIEPAGERIVKWGTHHRSGVLIRGARDELDARGIHRHKEDASVPLVLHGE